MRIGLTYDLRAEYLALGYGEEETAEFDQQGTIDALAGAIESLGHTIDRIGSARSLIERLAKGDRWELVFNIAEGLYGYGREAQVPAILDVYGIAYTFADPLAASVCLHKGWSKMIVRAAGVPTADFRDHRNAGRHRARGHAVSAARQAHRRRHRQRGYAEVGRALEGRTRRGRERIAPALPPAGADRNIPAGARVHRRHRRHRRTPHAQSARSKSCCAQTQSPTSIRTRTRKSASRSSTIVTSPAPIRSSRKPNASRSMRGLRCDCRDGGRVDIRCDAHGQPMFLEVNPLAGLHPTHSDLPMIATAVGMPYAELDPRDLRFRRHAHSADARPRGTGSECCSPQKAL